MNIRQSIVNQFKQPHGLLGTLAGHVMANRPSNIERNLWMLELLELKRNDRVLEIGYGPGVALERVLKTVDDGIVIGIDHSETMFKQASRRMATAISKGKLKLLTGDIESHPSFDTCFDHIYSANVIMFWKNPVAVFQHIQSFLAPYGDVTTLFMPRHRNATSKDSYKFGNDIANWLKQAGFADIHTEVKEFNGLAAVCVIARGSGIQ
jgi:cyclopropane fatty-acyl-phospholipid synthase-like methyltransferase